MPRLTPPVKRLELNLWTPVLGESSPSLEPPPFPAIWQALDAALPHQSIAGQLSLAGETIAQATNLFQDYSARIFESLDAVSRRDGPCMPLDAFDRYIRQTQDIDWESYVEAPAALPRSPRPTPDEAFYSTAVPIEASILLESLPDEIEFQEWSQNAILDSIAYEENLSAWCDEIRSQFQNHSSDVIDFLTLVRSIDLLWVEVWLGLLLGGYGLEREAMDWRANPEAFYQPTGIWIWGLRGDQPRESHH